MHVDRIGSLEELLAGVSGDDARRLARVAASSEQLEWTSVDAGRLVFTPRGARLMAHLLEMLAEGKAVLISEADKLISPEEAAQILGVSRPTVVKWIREGRLADYPVGAQHRLDYADVLRVLGQRRAVAELAREQARAALATEPVTTATPDAVLAATVSAIKGDDDQLERNRLASLAERARAAAAAAAQEQDT